MKEFIVFGDYREQCGPRSDFKIFDFVLAQSPEEAFNSWKASFENGSEELPEWVQQEVYVMEIERTRFVFDLVAGRLCQRYVRD